jgi:hypothetical protein
VAEEVPVVLGARPDAALLCTNQHRPSDSSSFVRMALLIDHRHRSITRN